MFNQKKINKSFNVKAIQNSSLDIKFSNNEQQSNFPTVQSIQSESDSDQT